MRKIDKMDEAIIQKIDNKVNNILNGTEDLHRFNQSEHAEDLPT